MNYRNLREYAYSCCICPLFLSLKTLKHFSGQMRELYAYVADESSRRLVEDGMSTELTNSQTALDYLFCIKCWAVSALKQRILCSALRHKSYLVMLHHFEIHSALELSRTALLGCRLADARLLVGNYNEGNLRNLPSLWKTKNGRNQPWAMTWTNYLMHEPYLQAIFLKLSWLRAVVKTKIDWVRGTFISPLHHTTR